MERILLSTKKRVPDLHDIFFLLDFSLCRGATEAFLRQRVASGSLQRKAIGKGDQTYSRRTELVRKTQLGTASTSGDTNGLRHTNANNSANLLGFPNSGGIVLPDRPSTLV